ncbi:MAG: hypothetical protein IAF38_04120 [Bacteroidia bacterium]|nr:hypothetical protein [Bacteroidia bacterium]
MKYLIFSLLIIVSLPSLAQKKKKPNWLRKEAPEPETMFTLAGKKNGKKIMVADLSKAEKINTIDKYFDGLEILGTEVIVKVKGAGEEKFSSTNLMLPTDFKTRAASLVKGDRVIVFVKTRNKSTQVVSVMEKHSYWVGG